jgi:hypothetical protein
MAKYDRPEKGTYDPYFDTYIDKVDTDDVLKLLKSQGLEIMYFLRGLTEEQGDYRYAEGKWTVKEVIGHLIDSERLFAFRGLWLARGAQDPQPGMDENGWAEISNAGSRPWPQLWREQHVARTDHVYLLRSFDTEAINRVGEANGSPFCVRAVPWLMAGHERHHLDVLYTKYGLKQG